MDSEEPSPTPTTSNHQQPPATTVDLGSLRRTFRMKWVRPCCACSVLLIGISTRWLLTHDLICMVSVTARSQVLPFSCALMTAFSSVLTEGKTWISSVPIPGPLTPAPWRSGMIMMIFWWYSDGIMMIFWRYSDDILMIFWWYFDDILMITWWYSDDILMIFWWYFDDILMVFWWYSDDNLMIFWWYFDDILMIFWWYSDGILMIFWW